MQKYIMKTNYGEHITFKEDEIIYKDKNIFLVEFENLIYIQGLKSGLTMFSFENKKRDIKNFIKIIPKIKYMIEEIIRSCDITRPVFIAYREKSKEIWDNYDIVNVNYTDPEYIRLRDAYLEDSKLANEYFGFFKHYRLHGNMIDIKKVIKAVNSKRKHKSSF